MSQPHLDRARELGDLLRSRRERLRPAEVGLPAGARRRTPGLRREEVAALAAISSTYYTFLEQGRPLHPSPQVLDALAGALRLTRDERGHLRSLVHEGAVEQAPVERLSGDVSALVERLDPYPTYVSGRYWDILAANRAACLLWTDWPSVPVGDRNILWWMFADPAARTFFVDWEREASAQLARVRAAAARFPADERYGELLDRVRAVSEEARVWWRRHEVADLSSGQKRLWHRDLGEFELRHVVLMVADEPEQKVVTFTGDDMVMHRIADLVEDR